MRKIEIRYTEFIEKTVKEFYELSDEQVRNVVEQWLTEDELEEYKEKKIRFRKEFYSPRDQEYLSLEGGLVEVDEIVQVLVTVIFKVMAITNLETGETVTYATEVLKEGEMTVRQYRQSLLDKSKT